MTLRSAARRWCARSRESKQACTDSAREPVSLTFFEYNALAALLIFEAAELDAWVLEIGMGGRLDAVNVVDPAVAVVVSIGLDHQEFLGSTLDSIAREKAGIFRARTPAVLGSSRDAIGAGDDGAGDRRTAQALGTRIHLHPARRSVALSRPALGFIGSAVTGVAWAIRNSTMPLRPLRPSRNSRSVYRCRPRRWRGGCPRCGWWDAFS